MLPFPITIGNPQKSNIEPATTKAIPIGITTYCGNDFSMNANIIN